MNAQAAVVVAHAAHLGPDDVVAVGLLSAAPIAITLLVLFAGHWRREPARRAGEPGPPEPERC